MKPAKQYDYVPHPIAAVFPMASADELASMAESIKKNGQRRPIVLVEGKVLDGRNRLAACELAGVMPITREFGSEITDGASLPAFVSDMNLEHRFLDIGQRATLAEELVPYYEAEGSTTTEAIAAVSAKLNVSPSSVKRAAALKEKAPEKFEEVKAGTKTLNKATQEADKEKLKQLEETAEEQKLADARKKFTKTVEKNCGETFGQAFARGTILKREEDFDLFVTLPKEEMQLLQDLIVKGWSVKRASKFMHSTLDEKNTIEDLINFANGDKDKNYKTKILGYVITVRKQAEGEII